MGYSIFSSKAAECFKKCQFCFNGLVSWMDYKNSEKSGNALSSKFSRGFLGDTIFLLGTEKGQRKFWERLISMICFYSKYVKNCNIFMKILNIWVKLILKKKFEIFFQCLGLPKDPQSFGSQNLRRPLSVSQ